MDITTEWIRQITQLPVQTMHVGWRLHRRQHEPEFYFRGPARFVPDQEDVGILYLASDELTATMEFVGGLKAIPSSDLEKYTLAELQFSSTLTLADITSQEFPYPDVLKQLQSADHLPSQQFATLVYSNGLNGVCFESRSGGQLFAVFGPVGSGREAKVAKEAPIPEGALKKLGVEVLDLPGSDSLWTGVS
ncbi:RES domain-containing protein [Streptomyces sp. BV333]|uniref:RES family NAD+ phosphorylase n=1 Tax=Streptomyces sp. BV333 TaxID=2849673 RepID=UPI001C2EAC15|nr:RES family NAD+ phosphorylase [Streptomyces sp. BV333]MBV1957739.1 RES domain-containing protein [Streptomyces sp. BV333]